MSDSTDESTDVLGLKPPEPGGGATSDIYLTVVNRGSESEVHFQDADGVLATMRGPRAMDALAWIMASITSPFTSVRRK